MTLSRSVAGRVAIVTGAASGMGRATALLLASEGAKVAVTDLDLAACEAVAAEAGPNAKAFALDVADGEAIKTTVAAIAAHFGGIDILINNAGVSSFAPLDAEDEYEAIWHRALAVMLTAHQRMVRAALPFLRKSDAARIVNIASTKGLGATPGNTPYVAAKTGVTGLTRGLAVDLGKEGITVNCICPGYVWTPLVENQIPDTMKARDLTYDQVVNDVLLDKQPQKQFVQVDQLASLMMYLVSDGAAAITGATLSMDGGWTAQ